MAMQGLKVFAMDSEQKHMGKAVAQPRPSQPYAQTDQMAQEMSGEGIKK